MKLNRNTHQNVLDGDLLWRYPNLELGEQKRLAKQIGTTVEQIMDNLLEIDLAMQII
jgi:cleavage and polyadenylation specificity factor subunit 1